MLGSRPLYLVVNDLLQCSPYDFLAPQRKGNYNPGVCVCVLYMSAEKTIDFECGKGWSINREKSEFPKGAVEDSWIGL